MTFQETKTAPPYFPARARINLSAITHNAANLVGRAAERNAEVMAVVKANGYGHGLVESARAALAGGATWLGVAQSEEALELRAAGITSRIFTWLYGPGVPFAKLIDRNVDVSVCTPWAVTELLAAAKVAGKVPRVHLKIDTGLGRNGVPPQAIDTVLAPLLEAQAQGTIELVGIWSHLAFADEPEHPTVLGQAQVFNQAIAHCEAAGARFEVRHIANSAATLSNPDMFYDLVRPGIALYGLVPSPQMGTSAEFGLIPAMTLEADLVNVKVLPANHGISYGHQYRTATQTVTAVVPLGYADGIPRSASSSEGHPGGPVQVGALRTAVAGRVCMDQFVVDLGPDATTAAGEVVVLFGDPTTGVPSADDWALAADTINYEITTRLGARVPRIYQ
ncbi:alanine racemase [Jonesiaceae bacterium BS-20]|uniref:Alanine racemase n=1 Tax=Jonesiaceae bacterium BS-20 TaxID=3120821 RepID=A0AAU7DUD5_9MICO